MILVLANGCFDVFHKGHLEHLQEARKMGTELVVALTLDEFVRKGPGTPINCWEDRRDMLLALRCVDAVVPAVSASGAIAWLRPQFFVKGIDYAGGDKFTEDVEGACKQAGSVLRYTSAPKRSAAEILRKVQYGPPPRDGDIWNLDPLPGAGASPFSNGETTAGGHGVRLQSVQRKDGR